MADKDIGSLTAVDLPLGGTELLHVVDADGNSRKIALSDLKTFINTDPTVVPSSEPWRGARVRRTSNLSVANNTATIVSWETEDDDTDAIWSIGAPTRLTVPTGVTKVRLALNTSWASAGAGAFDVMVYKNGAVFHGMPRQRIYTGATANTNRFNVNSSAVSVVSGDYFEARLIQLSGGAINLLADEGTWFGLEIIEG